MGYIIFDDINSRSLGIEVSGAGRFDAPERDVEIISVPGRNGNLIIDNGRYNNIEITYPAVITTNFAANAESAKAAFLSRSSGYYRLTDSYDTVHFRLARYSGGMEFSPGFLNKSGQFSLSFDCKPQRYLTSGETAQRFNSNSDTITNPTSFEARPLIYCSQVAANTTLTINEYSVRFTSATPAAEIDCELYEAIRGRNGQGTNINNIINCDAFPVLSPGNNTISWTPSNGISYIEITPRWWTL